jgi:predicted RNA-binding Zn-ribbon protein involved in translation (DUF1610 family)
MFSHDPEIPFPCPQCSQAIPQNLSWLKANNQLTCPACGAVINYNAEEFFRKLDETEEELKKWGRDIEEECSDI